MMSDLRPSAPGGSGSTPRHIARSGASPLVRADKLSDQVYEVILRSIIVEQYPVNSRLPSENALCAQLGVSRPVVREALARLRADGLVSSRRGSGTHVLRRPMDAFVRFAPAGDIAEVLRCYQFRVGVESEAARHAARLRTSADLRAIRRALAKLDQAVQTGELGAEADREFHHAVAAASGNALFIGALQMVDRAMREGIRLARELSRLHNDERLALVQAEHTAIYQAIAGKDPDTAAWAMHRHIDLSRARLIGERKA